MNEVSHTLPIEVAQEQSMISFSCELLYRIFPKSARYVTREKEGNPGSCILPIGGEMDCEIVKLQAQNKCSLVRRRTDRLRLGEAEWDIAFKIESKARNSISISSRDRGILRSAYCGSREAMIDIMRCSPGPFPPKQCHGELAKHQTRLLD